MKKSFCIDYNTITNSLPITVHIKNPYNNDTKVYCAVIDTGATNTVISKKIFSELSLDKTGEVELFCASGSVTVCLTLINITLPK